MLVLTEVILASRDVVADLPDALPSLVSNAEEWVEGGWSTIIRIWNQRAAIASDSIAEVRARASANGLYARQACLEGHAAVSHTVSLTHQGAGEEDRGWVQRRVAIGPYRLVGNAVEASVGPKAPRYRNE